MTDTQPTSIDELGKAWEKWEGKYTELSSSINRETGAVFRTGKIEKSAELFLDSLIPKPPKPL